MEHSAKMILSQQKLADHAEMASCLGSPHCLCSHCKVEVAFGDFPITNLLAEFAQAKWLSESPKMAKLGDKHRCTRFPCPVCHPGRAQRDCLSSSAVPVVIPEMLEMYAHAALHPHGVVMFGDGGHTCRKFPCPVCGKGGRSAALEVEVGC